MSSRAGTVWDLSLWDSELVWSDRFYDTKKLIRTNNTHILRKIYIKRRQISDGLFESDWYEITDDVKKWGTVSSSLDYQRIGKYEFGSTKVTMQNVEGRYNPNTEDNSLWYGYGEQQRTLVKIECGFYSKAKTPEGLYTNEYQPDDPTIFIGIISGNINVSTQNEVVLPIQPLTQVFKDYPAHLIDGFTSTGITASDYVELLRDQTDGSGSFVFRPFFGNTTTYWDVTSTSIIYAQLNTSTSSDFYSMDVWDVLERLAESEQYVPYITREGYFTWRSKTVGSTTAYKFYGANVTEDTEYGTTIKNILSYGKKLTNFYSRVNVKYVDENTSTSFINTGLAFAISGSNTAWNLGHRTFRIDNFWIPNSTVAASVADTIFDEVSSLKKEIIFTTSLIPHLSLLDRVEISHSATDLAAQNNLWDLSRWDDDFEWSSGRGDAIVLQNAVFKILSININLEQLETTFACREI